MGMYSQDELDNLRDEANEDGMDDFDRPEAPEEILSIMNHAGQTFSLGQRVRHYDGWEGTITGFRETRGTYQVALLIVEPDDISALPRHYCYPLNAEHAARTGRSHFCEPRDNGLSMGNYEPLPTLTDTDEDEEGTP